MNRESGAALTLDRPLVADDDDETDPTEDGMVATEETEEDVEILVVSRAAAELADAGALARVLPATAVAFVDDDVTDVVDLVEIAGVGVDDVKVAFVVTGMVAVAVAVADVAVTELAVGVVTVLPDNLAAMAANDKGGAGVDAASTLAATGAKVVDEDGGVALVDEVLDAVVADDAVVVVGFAAGAADVAAAGTGTGLRARTATGIDMAAATNLAAGVDDVGGTGADAAVDAGVDALLKSRNKSADDEDTGATVDLEVGTRLCAAADVKRRGEGEGADAGNNEVPVGGCVVDGNGGNDAGEEVAANAIDADRAAADDSGEVAAVNGDDGDAAVVVDEDGVVVII
jgi:hypothetical protein